MINQSERAARWREHVERWRRSGQTQTAYSADHGLSKKSLGYWIRRLREPLPHEQVVPLTLVAAHPVPVADLPSLQAAGVLSLRSPSGWRVEFDALPPAPWLAELIAQGAA
ncbi:transposase [Thauera humireducens]|jgi:hypothetical protein|uniref:IS66 family insertion sequence element accessory protein TnpA n=1 Tax=Thauera humireducens TaxID=1134435 RepID=UPI002467AB3B|nr:hypothetical protein [Thauera humireducens]CAH1748636.1 transposase [Thauera humireducens]